MIEPENEKARGGTDDQVQLYAGVAAEKRDEPEQGGAFGTGDDQPAKGASGVRREPSRPGRD